MFSNSELLRSLEARIYELEQLLEISKSLNSILEYNDLIRAILASAMEYMKAVAGGVFVKESMSRDSFRLHRSAEGCNLPEMRGCTVGSEHPLVRQLEHRRTAISFDDLCSEVDVAESDLEPFVTLGPAMLTPLIGREELNGVLFVGPPVTGEEITGGQREFLTTIGMLAGVAVQNALLYDAASTDRLTGLKQRHVLVERLDRTIADCTMREEPLSVLMVDLDHFKAVNDRLGHEVGDQALRSVADTVVGSLRQTDIAARYGGEEFVILLPTAGDVEAAQVAERIRASVESAEIAGLNDRLTVSVGIAHRAHDSGESGQQTVRRADRALYRAKRRGRNCVVVE